MSLEDIPNSNITSSSELGVPHLKLNTHESLRTSPKFINLNRNHLRQRNRNLALIQSERSRRAKVEESRARLQGLQPSIRIDSIPCPNCLHQGRLSRIGIYTLGCNLCDLNLPAHMSTEDILSSIERSIHQHQSQGCSNTNLTFDYEDGVGYLVSCLECSHLDVIF